MVKATKEFEIERGASVPRAGVIYPFKEMRVNDAFYVDKEEHQAVRTAASRAGKALKRKYSVRKVKDPAHKQSGRIGIYRIK